MSSLSSEALTLRLSVPTNPATALPHLGVIRVAGADAASFLHNQLTQDVVSLGADEARLAGYCSVKGRLLATFIMVRPSPDDVLLITPRDGIDALAKRLGMFVLRAKAKLTVADTHSVGGVLSRVAGSSEPAAAPSGSRPPSLPVRPSAEGEPQIQLPPVEGFARVLTIHTTPPVEQTETMALWRWLEVRSGMAWVDAATADAFVPQMLNFEAVGGVNFKKGCYPGQEVVARSQYRGTLKRRAYLLHSAAPLTPGQELFSPADPAQPGGQVAMAAPRPAQIGGGFDAIAELKVALADATTAWHVGAADGPGATVEPVPYEIPPQD